MLDFLWESKTNNTLKWKLFENRFQKCQPISQDAVTREVLSGGSPTPPSTEA